MYNPPTKTPKDNSRIVFYLYTGNARIGTFKDEYIQDSRGNTYKMYQIQKWTSIDKLIKEKQK